MDHTDKIESSPKKIKVESDDLVNRHPDLVEAALELSQVGIWVADLISDTLIWDRITRRIHEVPEDFEPEILIALSFYKEGPSRDTVTRSVSIAISEGKPFDHTVQFISGKGQERWVRVIGKGVFENDICVRLQGVFQDVHEQKMAELKIAESESKHRYITDNLRSVLGVHDINGNYTFVSNSIKDQFGYDPEEMIGKNVYSYTHPDDIPRLIHAAKSKDTRGMEPEEMEFRFRHKSGKYLWSKSLTTIIQYGKNNKSIQSETYVIQEQKELEEKLSLSEASFRGSFEQSITGMALVDNEGKWMKINQRLCDIVGYTESELLKLSFPEITHPDDIAQDLKMFHELISGVRTGYEMEKRYIHKTGKIIHIFLAVSVIFNEIKKPIHVVSLATDITAQKWAEAAQLNLERRFRQIFNSTYQFIGFLEPDGTFLEINQTALDFAGLQSKDVVGKKFWDAYWWKVPPEMEAKLRGTIAKAAQGHFLSTEIKVRDKNKKKITVDFSIKPLFDVDGKVTSLLCEGHNIQDIIDARDVLDETICKLQTRESELETLVQITGEQNKRLLNFAHIVSHNLRSHASNLTVLLAMLAEEEDNDERIELFSHLHSATGQLNETIVNLNEVVAVNTNVHQKMMPIPLRSQIEKTLKSLNAQMQATKTSIHNDVPIDMLVKAVPAYLDSILLNFISNAIKYKSELRQPEIHLTASLSQINMIRLSIADNGKGIDLEKYGDKLFGMYNTFHGNTDARGIGLFITKNQIESMGGLVEVESTVDLGTTFHIHFPI